MTSWIHHAALAVLLLVPLASVRSQPVPSDKPAPSAKPKPAPALVARPTPPAHSVTTSRQFVIYADDKTARAKLAVRLEDVKTAWLRALGLRDSWKHPIIVNLDVTPPVRMRRPPKFQIGVFEGDADSQKIQIDIFDSSVLKGREFDAVILTALLTEFAYRNTPIKAGKPYERPQAWVVEGLYEMLRVKQSGLPAGVFERLIATGEPPRLANLLRVRPDQLDTISRDLFRAQSMTLIQTLLDLPDGIQGFAAFLNAPRRSPIGPEDLLVHFPSLQNEPSVLTRKWLLAMARASAADRANLLGLVETNRELTRALDLKAPQDPKAKEPPAVTSGPLALESIARSRGGRVILEQTGNDLLRIEIRSHPLFKPIIEEYRRIVADLAAHPKKRVQDRVVAVEEIRARLVKQSSEMESYLDWVELNKVTATDDEFNRLLEQLSALDERPRRPDAVTRYLDAIEERGW